jgi:hypothetical protein
MQGSLEVGIFAPTCPAVHRRTIQTDTAIDTGILHLLWCKPASGSEEVHPVNRLCTRRGTCKSLHKNSENGTQLGCGRCLLWAGRCGRPFRAGTCLGLGSGRSELKMSASAFQLLSGCFFQIARPLPRSRIGVPWGPCTVIS